jgi:hypothetical protein
LLFDGAIDFELNDKQALVLAAGPWKWNEDEC